MSSCEAVTVRVSDVVGWGIDRVRDTSAKEADPLSCSFESPGVVFSGVTSLVNHMGWYRLRARVARRRWVIC